MSFIHGDDYAGTQASVCGFEVSRRFAHPAGDGSLGNVEAEHGKLAMNPGCSPGRILGPEPLSKIETARNRCDSVSLAAIFAEDANFIEIFGGLLDKRPAIEAVHRHTFKTVYRGSQESFVLRSIRFLRADVAVVFARCHVKFKEGNDASVSLFPVNG